MKEFKYTIDGKVYNVEIDNVDEEKSVAQVKVNGESFEVGMEKPAEPEKKKVELGKPVAADAADEPSASSCWQHSQRNQSSTAGYDHSHQRQGW